MNAPNRPGRRTSLSHGVRVEEVVFRSAAESMDMGLDIDVPTPPDLTNRGGPRDQTDVELVGDLAEVRRAELEVALRDGAWQEAFEEWAAYTDLTEAEVAVLSELDVFQAFDFFWDADAERLDFEAPRLAPETPAAERVTAIEGNDIELVDDELEEFGRVVVEELTDAYPLWTEAEGDRIWQEEVGEARDEAERDAR